MIEVTATMLPSTVINDRSFAPQIASSAMIADSKNLFMAAVGRADGLFFYAGALIDLHEIAVLHASHRVVRPGHDRLAGLQPREDLEILIAGDAHLDGHELG